MPGAAITMGAGAAAEGGVTAGMAAANVAVTAVKGYRSAMDPMASRAAAKAAVSLGNFFVSQVGSRRPRSRAPPSEPSRAPPLGDGSGGA